MSLNNKEVQVVSCTLQELFDTNKKSIGNTSIRGQLSIPEYQRPYVWEERQLNRLLNDLQDHNDASNEAKPLFYLGSIILHRDNNRLNIIDGQQRITTMLLLKKLQDNNFQSGILYTAPLTIQNIKRNLSYLKAVKEGDVFDFMNNSTIEDLDFNEINITVVITNTEDLAYTFFETQNTGGIRLWGSDILKAHHLRAIPTKKIVNYQAKRWERNEQDKVEKIIQYLCKIRFWDNRNWRYFPFYREKNNIKDNIIEEFTENTLIGDDISYYMSAVKNENGRLFQMTESQYKLLKQPLWDGNNTMDYVNEYIELYDILFGKKKDYRIEDEFYHFVKIMMKGEGGTVFLKELLEISIITYISRFGFYKLFETTLWLHRAIYSLRVTMSRNVREDSIFKMVQINQFIDNILEVFTVEQLHNYLKRFSYIFNSDYTGENQSKGKYIKVLREYYGENNIQNISIYANDNSNRQFDKDLVKAIHNKINLYHGEQKI